jgi:rhamnogalacturonyl hydrolase YesR
MASTVITADEIEHALDRTYHWSRTRDYRGHTKHDALNSPLLKVALGWSKWTRILAIQGIMRFPVNLRPLLLVGKTVNPKGLALFTMGLIDRYRATNERRYLEEAETLLRRLLTLRSPGSWAGLCWGYPYPWQDLGFFAPSHTPNAVVTCFVGEAFLEAYRETGNAMYLETVKSVAGFLLKDLTVLKDTTDESCLAYMPLPMTMRVMDVSILIGALLAQYDALSGQRVHRQSAQKLLNYVIGRQTDYGAWYYTDPAEASPIRHDNYHTGFILDALWRYMQATDDWSWKANYRRGIEFYAQHLFNSDGSPRWMSDQDYPHDIHGAAQGIITFSRHREEYPAKAESIGRWALDRMYHDSGRFYYQEERFYRKRFTLMRWCNAWMARALARLFVAMKR